MKNPIVSSLLFIVSAIALADNCTEESKVAIETIQVAEDIYMIVGQGGNIGLAIDDDCTLLIDDQFAPLSKSIQAEIRKLTDKPVTYLLNTHFHFDHTDGNANFADSVSIIVAHENVRSKLKEGAVIEAFGKTMEPYPEPALPSLTYTQKLSIHQSDETIELLHFASAHTDGDTAVHFKNSNVIHAGDIFFSGMYPFIDTGNGGSVQGFIAAQEALLTLADNQTRIIPGHGLLSNKADLKRDLRVLKEIVDVVMSELAAGKNHDQIARHKTIREYDVSYGQGFLNAKQFIEILASGI